YNSLLPLVWTPKTVGRVSAFGWSMGYFGGIVLLVIILVFFVLGGSHGHAGLLHVPKAGGVDVRVAMLVATVWAVAFSLPVFFAVKVPPPTAEVAAERTGFLASYGVLLANIRGIWRASPNTIWFLLASAIFRDGLTGVFTFGGVIGHVVFGLSTTRVLLFGIAANVIAGIATVASGRLDDRLGPKPLIVTSLTAMSLCTIALFATRPAGAIVFWIFGLILCAFVGPAQSASRTFLARITPVGREGEVFGLYATTGRAAIWMSPALYAAAIALSPATTTAGRTAWGILGILVVILMGLAVLLPVKPVQGLHRPTLEDAAVCPRNLAKFAGGRLAGRFAAPAAAAAQARVPGPDDGRRAVADLELGQNGRDVVADRLLAQPQPPGDGGVGLTRRDQVEHVVFALGQVGETGRDPGRPAAEEGGHPGGQRGAEDHLTGRHRGDGPQDLIRVGALEDVAAGPGPHGRQHRGVVFQHGQD